MWIERVLYPVTTLGPGKRVGIWTSGCSKRCPRCISPEMWQPKPDKDVPTYQLVGFIKDVMTKNSVDGITISGGDPLEQPEALLEFITTISNDCSDILIYTGYVLDELGKVLGKEKLETVKKHAAVLIDGRYVHELNDDKTPLIGSKNQIIHYLDQNIKPKYVEYMRLHGRQVQNIHYADRLISVGIHNKGA